jgi:hypothetical protein
MSGALSSARGVALVFTLLIITVVGGLALSLALASSVDRLAASNADDSQALLNAAEAGLELAARELALVDDWNTVLDGSRVSALVDGPPGPRVVSPGLTIDLVAMTNRFSCGSVAACPDAAVQAVTVERPWGVNNPRWRPFLHTFAADLVDPRHQSPPYIAVWVGDDGREVDGNVAIDGGGGGAEGRYIVRARAEAFGGRGARRSVEAELARVCQLVDGVWNCLPGVRVRAWRLGSGVP